MATLRGDTSDGLPGVAGIGEKTAAKLIRPYGDLAALRRRWPTATRLLKGAQRARLEAGSDYLDVAPLVVRVAHDAPVDEHDATLPTTVADPVLLSGLASQYGLTSPINRVLTALGLGD